ncbi:NAD-dependent protein deacetylase [Pseudomonas sp. JBR1]|uniref:NAD-dependent protein deacetylase n=1 Tax=Pseudomonas sp. JBR1 TaxID=3020907 RepID=UPI0023053536|nr:NAD-dependent protein deacetylase [Pseudomonas sp. JBR1]WCE06788.1 NAD-dependent protein deacetylase [Pseudomonas sp. JBR1]
MSLPELQSFIARHERIFLLTGAGCSTDSGIPDYRDRDGAWKRPQPVTLQAFVGDELLRRRYWARSLIGWPRFCQARPNATHQALAALERRGQVEMLLTQNVDRLHQAAGSEAVIDLHGRLDQIRCLGCEMRLPRQEFQQWLGELNGDWLQLDAATAPDGDADLEGVDFMSFQVPDCPRCGALLKPDVVFFGEHVPGARVERAFAHLGRADALLVVGSSLMVYSGFRFAQAAARAGLPIAALGYGRTRADELLTLKVEDSCAKALAFLLEHPGAPSTSLKPALRDAAGLVPGASADVRSSSS